MALASWPSTSRCRGDKDSFTPRSDPRAHGTPAHTCSGRHNTEDAALLFTGHRNRTTGPAPLPAPAHSIHLPVLMSYGSLASELSESTLNKTRPEGDVTDLPFLSFKIEKFKSSRPLASRTSSSRTTISPFRVCASFRWLSSTWRHKGSARWPRRHCNGPYTLAAKALQRC